ncbi:MAG: hypothetical protein A2487_18250 [Candidatus Raymondbacteria bacterium RifOxyC12_full_50_8]|uniref:Uncharacterized protein n=1 Tax=Candidatus Raymondbacteria bacterium RIFOXYD12_FULL_49_13 TaxID=1817890 RepID=A0A1F7F5A8_UNCRA|nr:MAG: hypothetical protein A2350_08290 [Candidatus Raymondbacteria bacterium RifOxyB12_full_50_8]OGJ87176.1 MAG: hypothetical protein A2248_04035 [Candidatus Raymondbacteria bacterium RIFOXYA2_FULL_49_16]OGJ95343.1 MAG: hypothetical protein A2487_18250 [Candidatus Raymondbacteria bacterium RifOxyC12_full_50_8]OGK01821.1 MAG: hypothetical protein A2519_03090 [Candidatus Raymondbacteria bacterium RIFOXYD12_FULL_49_13]OGP41172.1 MAG: hypothetical protein A2324_08680 [Candidatus Raymondbacteria b
MKQLNKENLLAEFDKTDSFTTDNVFNFYKSLNPAVKRKTVNWRIYEFIQNGILGRIGRGVYTINLKGGFKIIPGKKEKSISLAIKKKFPFVSYCVWHTSILKEFHHHMTNLEFIIVEVEHEAAQPVFHHLKEAYKNTFLEPSKTLFNDFISGTKDAVIVKTLISEAPLQKIEGFSIPVLEKVLVDLYADSDIFFFIQGNEFLNILSNAVEKYSINYDKLLRYAARRGKREELKKILNQITGNK